MSLDGCDVIMMDEPDFTRIRNLSSPLNQHQQSFSSSCLKMRKERVLLRPWLENLIESGLVAGLEWIDVDKTTFKVPWKHRSKKNWSLQHCSVFLVSHTASATRLSYLCSLNCNSITHCCYPSVYQRITTHRRCVVFESVSSPLIGDSV